MFMKKILFLFLLVSISIRVSSQIESMMGGPSIKKEVISGTNYTDPKGLKQGKWEKRTIEGNLIYRATFLNDKPIGTLTRYYPNGKKMAIIEYDSVGIHGKAQLFNNKEVVFARGYYYVTLKDSIWSYIDPYQNVICTEQYIQGKHYGKTIYFYQNGAVYEVVNYVNDVKEGDWLQYSKSGKLTLKSQYSKGKLNGPFKSLFSDGSAEIVGFYKDDLEDGIWKFFKPDGKLDYQIKYKNGVILNAAEVDKIKQDRIKNLTKYNNQIKDPDQYRNDPDGYMNGN